MAQLNYSPKETTKKDMFPARYVLTLLLFFGMCLMFGHRVCLSVAMVAMVNTSTELRTPENDENYVRDANHCPLPNVTLNASQSVIKNVPVPWLKVIQSPAVWAVTIAKFCGVWSFLCFQSKLPAYLDEVLHLPFQKNGLANALLFGALCMSIVISGKISDFIRGKGYFKITSIRKSFETIAMVGPAACMAAITLVKCNSDAVIALLTSAMALYGLCGGGDVPIIVDMSPDFAGKIFGVANGIAGIPGILAPVAAGYLLEGNKGGNVQQWMYIFYISVGMYLLGAVVFLLFASAELQPWGRLYSKKSEDSKIERTLSA